MLAEMGIPVWRLRGTLGATTSGTPDNVPVLLDPIRVSTARYLILSQPSQTDQTLLANILKALNCPPEEAKILMIENPETLENHHWDNIPTIAFGEVFYPYLPEQAIRTLSLSELNNNIPAKKALWQRLKP
jgi:DNA polymerase III psi subunit